MESNFVLGAKSFLLSRRAAPAGKTRSSPASGAIPPFQLAGVVQLLFTGESPDQGQVESTRASSRGATVGRERRGREGVAARDVLRLSQERNDMAVHLQKVPGGRPAAARPIPDGDQVGWNPDG